MSKSNKYGYSGVDIPTQAFQANVGKFDPAEINELVANEQWTQYGQLEHIETISATSVSVVDFTNIKSDIYDVHFATYIIEKPSGGSAHYPGWQFAESGTMETASVYYGTAKWFSITGSGNNVQDATSVRIGVGIGSSYQMIFGGYCYFYNLGDSTKFSYATGQISLAETGGTVFNTTYAGVLRQGTSSFVDQIRFKGDSTLTSAKISLYGIRYA